MKDLGSVLPSGLINTLGNFKLKIDDMLFYRMFSNVSCKISIYKRVFYKYILCGRPFVRKFNIEIIQKKIFNIHFNFQVLLYSRW